MPLLWLKPRHVPVKRLQRSSADGHLWQVIHHLPKAKRPSGETANGQVAKRPSGARPPRYPAVEVLEVMHHLLKATICVYTITYLNYSTKYTK